LSDAAVPLAVAAFNLPTRFEYGPGVGERAGELVAGLGAKRVLVVTDKGVVGAGVLDTIRKSFEVSGLKVEVYDEIVPNPRDTSVTEGARILKSAACDGVVGLGGGSSMDAAKAIRAMAYAPGRINDYEGFFKFGGLRPPIPLVEIPTTSGTGSEADAWAVITDTHRCYKMGMGDPALAPDVALVDPKLTLDLPPLVTAGTGMDALCHALEVYVARGATPVTDALAIYAVELAARHLGPAVADGHDLEARAGMSLASMIAGMAMSNCDCGIIHSMAESVGSLYDVPHGLAIGAFLPIGAEYNLASRPAKFARLAEALGRDVRGKHGLEAAREVIAALRGLRRNLGVPTPRELGLNPGDFEKLATFSVQNMSTPGNPRAIDETGFVALFKRAYEEHDCS